MSVELEQHGPVALITMDDGKANAVGFDMVQALSDAFDEADRSASSIVLAGREGVFSGGFDLAIMQGGDPELLRSLVNVGGDLALRLYRTDRPVVVACTGHAYAYGALLVLAADSRIGEVGDKRIALPETQLGMPLPQFGIDLVKERLRPDVAASLAVQSRAYSHPEALEAGILTELVEPGTSVSAALTRAAELADLPAGAYAATKSALRNI